MQTGADRDRDRGRQTATEGRDRKTDKQRDRHRDISDLRMKINSKKKCYLTNNQFGEQLPPRRELSQLICAHS